MPRAGREMARQSGPLRRRDLDNRGMILHRLPFTSTLASHDLRQSRDINSDQAHSRGVCRVGIGFGSPSRRP
eukprot:8412097-Pyramimonas_sp.AAC.1